MSIKDASAIAGVHINTAAKWEAKKRKAAAEIKLAEVEVGAVRKKQGGVQAEAWKSAIDVADLPPVIPYERLHPEAKRGWDDFDYFRRRYLGRVPSPWQVDAAYKIVQMLESPEKEFIVINCPPGAGKSTLFHDFAVWIESLGSDLQRGRLQTFRRDQEYRQWLPCPRRYQCFQKQ